MKCIKNYDRYRLCLETLDTLMFLSLSAPQELHEVDWNVVYETWRKMKLPMTSSTRLSKVIMIL